MEKRNGKKRLWTQFMVMGVLIAILGLWTVGSANAQKVLRFSVGRVGGTYYVMGSGVAEIIKKNIPGYSVELTTASGSMEDMRLLQSKQVELTQGPTTTLYDAREGLGDFAKEKAKYTDIRHALNMHPNTWSPIVLKGSDIKKFTDIKGKSIAVPSSGQLQIFRDHLEAYGMKIEDVKWQYLPYTQAADALADRKVDMVFFNAGLPVAAADELSHRVDIRILELDGAAADNLVKNKSFYSRSLLPAGTYKGVDKDIPASQILTTLICHKDLDPDFVYQLCKQFYANLDYLKTVHPSAKYIQKEDAASSQVFPLHPGAEKYYKEVKLIK